MANKFLNVLINSVVTPVNIDDVVAVAATGQNGGTAATVAITYKSGKVATLSTPADNDGFNVNCYDQGITPIFGIYTGGENDGFDVSCYSEHSVLTNLLFYGGDNDGFDVSCYSENSALKN